MRTDATNPYEAPGTRSRPASARSRLGLKKLGDAVSLLGGMVLGYGALAFWVIQGLPPNGGPQGRLPSLYVMGLGILCLVGGLVMRDLRVGGKQAHPDSAATGKAVPTRYGLAILVALLALTVLAISRL